MIVQQIWTANAFRTFNYLIVCEETGEALAVDPLDHEKCLKVARDHGYAITQILNTHEQRDHAGGNEPVVRQMGAKVLAHKNAKDAIPGMDRGLGAGNCHHGGHPAERYRTFAEQLAKLPVPTLVYPGHDYIENNLCFTLDREPDNASAREGLAIQRHLGEHLGPWPAQSIGDCVLNAPG